MKKYSTALTFLLSIILGALIWLLSLFIFGITDIWDTPGFYYILSLFIAGFIPGFILPKHLWFWALGVVIGQFIAGSVIGGNLSSGLFGILSPIFMIIYSLLSLLGAGAGFAIRSKWARRSEQHR